MSEIEQFAYGLWGVEGAKCPISAAGFEDYECAVGLAEDFDDLAQTMLELDRNQGMIDKEDAKKVWRKLKEITEANVEDPMDEWTGEYHRKKLELIKKVEEEVFDDD